MPEMLLALAFLFALGAIFGRRKAENLTSPTADAVCGKCGYNVKGLTTFTCPECGSDLREVGILRPRVRAVTSDKFWWKLLGFAVVWFIVGGLVGRALGATQVAKLWVMVWFAGMIGGSFLICYLEVQKAKRNPPLIAADGNAPPPATTRLANPTTRTATIMFSDIADFSAAAASAPRDTLLELVRRHRELVQGVVARRGGRIVKSIGDGLLMTFESATEALLAGLEIQTALRDRNSAAFTDRDKFHLRIAVVTGEITLTGDDVFGHAVNVASRVQQLAQNSDVYFTDSTYHAMNRNEITSESVGAFDLKGIGNINVYRAVKQ